MSPFERRVAQLAELPEEQYERQRKQLAKELEVRAPTLDKAVAEARKRKAKNTSTFTFETLDPWPDSVHAPTLLQRLSDVFRRFVVLGQRDADAAALWVLKTYCFDAFNTSPMLALESATPRCGKTTMLGVTAALVHRPVTASNISPSALFRFIDAYHPTTLLDEADTYAKTDENLRGILNSGHTRSGAFAIRCEGEGAELEPRKFSTWCPKLVALIGRLPATLQDRSIVIALRRKLSSERVERYRSDRPPEEFQELRQQALRWAIDNFEALREADPTMPDRLNDRAADNWRPLVALADLAGHGWPERARTAALALSGADREVSNLVELLLSDIAVLFDSRSIDRIRSQELADHLGTLADRPWSEFNRGKTITTNQLARQLEPLDVRPKKIRFGETTAQGYERTWFADAFARYLPPFQTGTPEQTNVFNGLGAKETGTDLHHVPVSSARNPLNYQECSGVPVCEEGTRRTGASVVCFRCANFEADETSEGRCRAGLGDVVADLPRDCAAFAARLNSEERTAATEADQRIQ
jgi:putative DNA primase/helicase